MLSVMPQEIVPAESKINRNIAIAWKRGGEVIESSREEGFAKIVEEGEN